MQVFVCLTNKIQGNFECFHEWLLVEPSKVHLCATFFKGSLQLACGLLNHCIVITLECVLTISLFLVTFYEKKSMLVKLLCKGPNTLTDMVLIFFKNIRSSI